MTLPPTPPRLGLALCRIKLPGTTPKVALDPAAFGPAALELQTEGRANPCPEAGLGQRAKAKVSDAGFPAWPRVLGPAQLGGHDNRVPPRRSTAMAQPVDHQRKGG